MLVLPPPASRRHPLLLSRQVPFHDAAIMATLCLGVRTETRTLEAKEKPVCARSSVGRE